MEPPLYVEVSPLLATRPTGLARFTARVVEALARICSLRLFSTIPRYARDPSELRDDLVRGEQVAITAGSVPESDGDLEGWTRALLRRPRAGADRISPQSCACLYTLHRPVERYFAREVSILYDFTPLILPWAHVAETRRQFGDFFSRALAGSDKAVAISRSTQADARWLCPLPPEDVVVAYPGPSLCVRAHANAEPVERATRLLLVVATLEPRKNAAFLRDWFLNTQVLPPDTELCWVGPEGWLWNLPRRWRDRRRAFRFLGMVSDRELCALYRRATFTICPSLYEGFGFPVLDALWHGTPVACSFNSSLKEFEGSGVYYFDPCDAGSLDRACRDLLAASPLVVDRPDLRARCSWDALARTVVSLCVDAV